MSKWIENPYLQTAAGNILASGLGVIGLNIAGLAGAGALVDAFGEASGRTTGLGIEYVANTSQELTVPPASAKVRRYAAFITGKAVSEFTVDGRFSRLGCSTDARSHFMAVGTVAARAADIEVPRESDTLVEVNIKRMPTIDSGFDLSESRTSTKKRGLGVCFLHNALDLQPRMWPVAQATANTIADCILAKPEFTEAFKESVTAFFEHAHPQAEIRLTLPQVSKTSSSASVRKLKNTIEAQSTEGNSINATPVADCKFEDFKVMSFSLEPDTRSNSHGQ